MSRATAACHLHVTTHGRTDAPPVLLLHGFLGRGADWKPIARALGRTYYCVAPDLPGHGKSGDVPPECGWDGACGAVLALLDRLGIGRCAIVGYSMGGRLALSLALKHRRRFAAAVIESATAGLPRAADRLARGVADDACAAQLERTPMRLFLRAWYAQDLFRSLQRRPALLRRVLRARTVKHGRRAAAALRAMSIAGQPSHWRALRSLKTPVLFVSGKADRKYSRSARELQAACANATRVCIDSAGHNVHLEQPAAFAMAVRNFLERQYRRR